MQSSNKLLLEYYYIYVSIGNILYQRFHCNYQFVNAQLQHLDSCSASFWERSVFIGLKPVFSIFDNALGMYVASGEAWHRLWIYKNVYRIVPYF